MGKPVAGQLGQPQMGGGFGGQQSPMLQKPMQPMEPQMPQQNLGGYGGGMGAFQDFMRQQQASQMPQQPAYEGFGNGMAINIAQPPQQSGGLLGSLRPQQPQQNPGGFGNQQQQSIQSQLQQALQSFRGQQQMGQQAPQMPMIGPGGGSRDFYDRQMQPPQEFGPSQAAAQAATLQSMGSGFGQNSRPDLTGGPMGAPQPPTLGQATQAQMQQPQQAAQAQQIYALNQQLQAQGRPGMLGFSPEQMQQSLNQVGGQPQMPMMNQPLGSMQDRANRLVAGGLADFKPQMPQQVRPEPPRMQAMRGIQQLANRQRGYNR